MMSTSVEIFATVDLSSNEPSSQVGFSRNARDTTCIIFDAQSTPSALICHMILFDVFTDADGMIKRANTKAHGGSLT